MRRSSRETRRADRLSLPSFVDSQLEKVSAPANLLVSSISSLTSCYFACTTDPNYIREDIWKIVTRKRAEFLLKRREASTIYDRPGNPIKRCDTSALQSNEYMEDRSAEKILEGAEGE